MIKQQMHNFLPMRENATKLSDVKTNDRIYVGPKSAIDGAKTRSYIPELIRMKHIDETNGSRGKRCAKFFSKCLPLCALLTLIGGTTFLGTTLIIINEGNVGFDNHSNVTYVPGLHFQAPWTNHRIEILPVGRRQITLWNVRGQTADEENFEIDVVTVEFVVVNRQRYIDLARAARSADAFESQLSARLVSLVSDELSVRYSSDIASHPDNGTRSFVYGMELPTYGIVVEGFNISYTKFESSHIDNVVVRESTSMNERSNETPRSSGVKTLNDEYPRFHARLLDEPNVGEEDADADVPIVRIRARLLDNEELDDTMTTVFRNKFRSTTKRPPKRQPLTESRSMMTPSLSTIFE